MQNVEDEYILILDDDEAKALGRMIEGTSLEERRIFHPVLCKMRKKGLI
jgi:hypothetical protein